MPSLLGRIAMAACRAAVLLAALLPAPLLAALQAALCDGQWATWHPLQQNQTEPQAEHFLEAAAPQDAH